VGEEMLCNESWDYKVSINIDPTGCILMNQLSGLNTSSGGSLQVFTVTRFLDDKITDGTITAELSGVNCSACVA
jgi:hypothetical protein